MDLSNKRVKHKFNGEGTIINQNQKYIYVRFDEKDDTEKYSFPYPKVFLDGIMILLPIELNLILKNELDKLGLDTSKLCVSGEQKINNPAILRIAEKRTISARTNFELINLLLNKNLKGLPKSGYKISSNILLWMIHIDGKERYNWINTWIDKDTILEEYVGNDNYTETNVKEPYRIVAEIKDGLFGREYKIHGLFKCVKEETTSKKHLWKREI